MTDNDFHAQRTVLMNQFAAAGAELLGHMAGAAGALAAIPNTHPQQYAVAGDLNAIPALLPNRRERRGERPTEELYFGPATGQPRRWAALITSAGHGVLQEYGTRFEHAQPGQEVLEVMEILPAAANKAAEEGELPDFKIYSVIAKAGWDVDDNYRDELYKLCKAAIAADRAYRQVANVPSEIAKVLGLHEPVSVVCAVQAIKALMPVCQVANKAEVDLSDDQIYDFWLYRDCMPAIQAGDMKAQFVSAVRALLATSPATPPATTGANTVLTDESKLRDFIVQWSAALYPNPDELMTAIKANIGQSVAAQAGQVAVPEGWKLVPEQPTHPMVAAGGRAQLNADIGTQSNSLRIAKVAYAAMLAAAPSAPAVAQQAPIATIDTREFRELLAKAMDAAELATRTGDPHRDYKPARDALVAHIDARLGAQASTPDGRQGGGDREA